LTNCLIASALPLRELGKEGLSRSEDEAMLKSVREKMLGMNQKIDVSADWEVKFTSLPRPASEGGDVPITVYVPKAGPSDMPAILYAHGGGCMMGDENDPQGIETFKAVLADMRAADKNAKAFCWVSVGYRLVPENPFPKPVDDVVFVYNAMMEPSRAQDWGYAPGRVGLFGVSSGAYLCSHAAVRVAKDLKAPAFLGAINPMVDPVMTKPSYTEFGELPICPRSWLVKCWKGLTGEDGSEARLREVSLLHLDWATCKNMRSLNVTASAEIFHDDGIQLNEVQKAAGVELTPILAAGSHVLCLTFDKPAAEKMRSWVVGALQAS